MLDKRGTAALRRKQKKERTAFIDSQIPMSLSLSNMNISLKIMRLIF